MLIANLYRHRAIGLVIAVSGCALGASSATAQVWRNNIPDTFQHQRWGARAGQLVPQLTAGGNPVAPPATIAVPGAADPDGDGTWQNKGYFPAAGGAAERAFFYGMCFQASNINQLYHFRQRGYTTFGAANPANATQLHDQVKPFEAAFNTARQDLLTIAQDATRPAAERLRAAKGLNTPNLINTVLNARGSGPNQGFNGLIAQNFKQVGDDVVYIGADGATRNLGKSKLADHIPQLFNAGDLGNLRLAYQVGAAARTGTPQEGLWWAGTTPDGGNFHNVTIAGYDRAGAGGNGTIFFADPDSNPHAGNPNQGNRDIDAGWVTRTGAPPNLDRWKNPTAAIAQAGDVKPERFAAGAGVPVPGAFVGGQPPANDQSKLYYTGTLAGTRDKFAVADAAFDRYNNVEIRYLETLETIKAIAKPAGAGVPGSAKGFSITTGAADATNRINDFWIFPTTAEEVITSAIIPDAGDAADWSISLINASLPFTDPWGNERLYGGLHVSTLSGSVGTLEAGDILDLDYETFSTLDVTAWDFIYNDRFDLSLDSLGVQSYGGFAGYDLATEQVPSPGALGLLGLGLFFSSGRRRR